MICVIIIFVIIAYITIYQISFYKNHKLYKNQLILSISHSHQHNTILNVLLRFLIDNNCLGDFLYYFDKTNNVNYNDKLHKLSNYVTITKKTELISKAFIWQKTQNGFNFWNDINNKWQTQSKIKAYDVIKIIDSINQLNIK